MLRIKIKNITVYEDTDSLRLYGVRRGLAYIDEGLAITLKNMGVKVCKLKYDGVYMIHLYNMPDSVKGDESYERHKQNPDLIFSIMKDFEFFGSTDIFVHVYEWEFQGHKGIKLYYEELNTD